MLLWWRLDVKITLTLILLRPDHVHLSLFIHDDTNPASSLTGIETQGGSSVSTRLIKEPAILADGGRKENQFLRQTGAASSQVRSVMPFPP